MNIGTKQKNFKLIFMKLNYLFSFILIIIFSNLSFAQFENGELSLGGGLGFQNSKSVSTHYDPYYSYGYVIRDTTNIFRISPSLLIFAGKKFRSELDLVTRNRTHVMVKPETTFQAFILNKHLHSTLT